MLRRFNWGWTPLLTLAAAAVATPALAGSHAIEGVPYGAGALTPGLVLLGVAFVIGFTATLLPRVVTVSALAVIGIALLVPVVALAQAAAPASNTVLTVAWGDMVAGWFRDSMSVILPILSLAITTFAGRLAWWGPMIFTTARVDRALQTGADYAINAVEGAVAGKVLSKDVGYVVLKVGLERILGSTPGWLIKELGGAKGIVERLFRVFKFDESVTDKNTLQKVIDDLPTFPFAKGK